MRSPLVKQAPVPTEHAAPVCDHVSILAVTSVSDGTATSMLQVNASERLSGGADISRPRGIPRSSDLSNGTLRGRSTRRSEQSSP